jgi:uncharacterized membrane protein YbjE (DUF340 family)
MDLELLTQSDIFKQVAVVILATLGTIETVKNLWHPAHKQWYALLTLIVSAGYALLFFTIAGTDKIWIEMAILAWALSQLAYDLILKTVITFFSSLIKKIEG